MCRVEFFKIGKRDVTFIREMRVGNLSVSAVVYNDSAVRKEDAVITENKKYKSEVLLDFCKKSKDSYLPILYANHITSDIFLSHCVYVTKMQFVLHIRIRDHPGNCKKNIFSANNA